MEVSGHLYVPAASLPEKQSRYPLYMRLGGPQSRPGRYGKEKKLCLYRESNSDSLVVQYGAQRTWNGPVQGWLNVLNIGAAYDNFQ
jgi:hypothetical protein